MEPKRLSLGLLVLGLALVVLPSVREGLGSAVASFGPGGGSLWAESTLRRAIKAAPDDAQVWLGVAELRAFRVETDQLGVQTGSPTDAESVVQAYEKAIELDPDAPVARLRLALFHLGSSGSLTGWDAYSNVTRQTVRSPEQQRALEEAEPLLREARAAEPNNAACDYLLAWCLLAEQRDAEAHRVLAGALDKDGWDVHEREAALAACRVAELAGIPPVLRSQAAFVRGGGLEYFNGVRHLVMLLETEATSLRTHGDHAQAIARYRAAAHMGSLMRRHAYTGIEGHIGISVSRIVSGGFAVREGDQDREQVTQARFAGYAAYLRSHGSADEADAYLADMQAAAQWTADMKQYTRRMMPEYTSALARAGTVEAMALVVAAGGVFALAALAGLVSLALRCWTEPRAKPAFGYGGWALLVGLAVAPGQAAAFLGAHVSASERAFGVAFTALLVASIASAVAWAVVGAVVAARRREAGRPAFRSALAGLRQLALPTLVVLLVLALALSAVVHRGLVQMDRHEMQIVEQGEVQYWGIGTGHVAPASGAPVATASP